VKQFSIPAGIEKFVIDLSPVLEMEHRELVQTFVGLPKNFISDHPSMTVMTSTSSFLVPPLTIAV